jgi:esterase/lipase superfamily enzyme
MGANHTKANERFVRANMSLDHNNYHNNNSIVVGFSWDANPNKNNWTIAKSIAKDNGPKLAQFILNYADTCKNLHGQDIKIRLIAHSLGARVVLSALDSLYNNQKWNSEKFKVTSVNFIGAAVDDEEISKDLSYIQVLQL